MPTCINKLSATSEEEEVEDVVFKHFPTRRRKIKPTRHTTSHKLHLTTTLLPFCEYDDYDDEDDSNANIRILVMADTTVSCRRSTIPKTPMPKTIPDICKTKSISTCGKQLGLLQPNLLSTKKEYSKKKITSQTNPYKGYKQSTLSGSSTLLSTERSALIGHSTPVSTERSALNGSSTPRSTERSTLYGSSMPLRTERSTLYGSSRSTLCGSSMPLRTERSTLYGSSRPPSGEQLTLIGHSTPLSTERSALNGSSAPPSTKRSTLIRSSMPLGTERSTLYGSSMPLRTERSTLYGSSMPLRTERSTPYGSSMPLHTERSTLYGSSMPLRTERSTLHGSSMPLRTERSTLYGSSMPLRTERSTLYGSTTPPSTELTSKHSLVVLKISPYDDHRLYNKSSTMSATVSRKMLTNSPKITNKKFSVNQSEVTTCLTKPISSLPTKALKSGEIHMFHNKSSKQHSSATTVYLSSPNSLPPIKAQLLGEVQGVHKSNTESSTQTTMCLPSRHTLSQTKVSTLQTGHVSQIRPSRGSSLVTIRIPTSKFAKILTLQSHQTEQVTHAENLTEPMTNPYVSPIISRSFQGDPTKQIKTSTKSSTKTEKNNKFSPLQMALTLHSKKIEQMKSSTECLIQITTNPPPLINRAEQVMPSTAYSTMRPINSLISIFNMLTSTSNPIEEMKSCTKGFTKTAPSLLSTIKGITSSIMEDQLKEYKQPLKGTYGTTEWNSAFKIFASLIKKAQLEGMEVSGIQTHSPATRANSKLSDNSTQMSFRKTTSELQSGEIKLLSKYLPAARVNFLTGHSPKTSTIIAKNKLPNMNISSSPGLQSSRITTFKENNSTFSKKLPAWSIQKSYSGKGKYSGIEQHSSTTKPRSLRNCLPQTERSSMTRKRCSIIKQFLQKKGRSVSTIIKEYPIKHKFKRCVDNIKKAPPETSTKTKFVALDFTKQISQVREDITLPTLRPLPLEVTEDFSNDLDYDRDPVLDFDTENSDDLLDEMEMITPEEETKFTPKSQSPVSRHFEVESETIPINHNTMESPQPFSQTTQASMTQITRRLKESVSPNVHINKGHRQLKEKFDECLRSVPDAYIHPYAMIAPSDLLVTYAVTYPEEISENLKTPPPYKTFCMNTVYPVEPTQVHNQPALDTKPNMLTLINNMVKNALENKASETPETVVMVITVKNEKNATDGITTPASEVIMNLSDDVKHHNLFEIYHPEVIYKGKNSSVINNPETCITSTPEVPVNFIGLNSPIHYTHTTSAVEVPKILLYLNSSLHNNLTMFGPEVARNLAYLNIPLNNTFITFATEVTQDLSDLNNIFNSTYTKYTSEPARDLSGLRMLHSNTFVTSAPEVTGMSDLKHPFPTVSMISVPEVAKNFSDLKSSFQKISMSAPETAQNFSYLWRPFQNISIAPVQEVGKKLYDSMEPFITMSTLILPSLRNHKSSTVNIMNVSKVAIAQPFETHMAFFPFAIQNSELSGSKNSILPALDQNMMTSAITKKCKFNFSTEAKSTASIHTHVTSQKSQQTKSKVTSGTSTLTAITTGIKSPLNLPYFKGEDEEDNVNDYTVYTHSLSHTKSTAMSKTQKTSSHYKTQTSSIVTSTATSASSVQPTTVSSPAGKFHVIRTTLLYPNQSTTSTTTGKNKSKRSMTSASEPTGFKLEYISTESEIQNKSMQISTSSILTKSNKKSYSPDHPAASVNKLHVSSSSIIVPPKSLVAGSKRLIKFKKDETSARTLSLIKFKILCSKASTDRTQALSNIQITLPESLVTDWLQNRTYKSSSTVSEYQSSEVSTNEIQAPSTSPITLSKSSVIDNQVPIQNKTVDTPQTISTSVPEYHSSEIPPSSNVTHHLINITERAFSSLVTASAIDNGAMQTSTNGTQAPSSSPITLPKSSVIDKVTIQNKTVEKSQTISKSVSEYHSSEIPLFSCVTHPPINISQGAFSSLKAASVTDKCAMQTSTKGIQEPLSSPITFPKSSVIDNQVPILNKTVDIPQTISKSVPEYHSSEIPPSSNVTHHLINITERAFSSLVTASAIDNGAMQTSTNGTQAPYSSPITLPKSSVIDKVPIQNKTVEESQMISKSVPEYLFSEIPPSSNVTHHLINITERAFSSLVTASATDNGAMQTSINGTQAPSSSPITLPKSSVIDKVTIQNKTVEKSQTISKSVSEYHSSEIPLFSCVTHPPINISQGAFSSLKTASVIDECTSTQVLIQNKTIPISQSSSSMTHQPVSGFHPSEVSTTPAYYVPSVNITFQPASETSRVITWKCSQFQTGTVTGNINGVLIQTNTTNKPPVTITPVQPSQQQISTMVTDTTAFDTTIHKMLLQNQITNIDNKTLIHSIATQLPLCSVTFKDINELHKEERTTLTSPSLPVTTPGSLIRCGISHDMMMQNKTSKITSRSLAVISEPVLEQELPGISKILAFNSPVISTVPYHMEVQNEQIPSPDKRQPYHKMSLGAAINNSVTNKILKQNNAGSHNDKTLIQNTTQMPFPAMTPKSIWKQESITPPPTADIPFVYIVTDSKLNSLIKEIINRNKKINTDNRMLTENKTVKEPDQHETSMPPVYIITGSAPRNKSNEIVTHNKMKNVVSKMLKQTFTTQMALSSAPKSSKPTQKPYLQEISTLPVYDAPFLNTATGISDEILTSNKPTAQLPLSSPSVPLPVEQSLQVDILRQTSFGTPPTNIIAVMSKKIPIQNNITSKLSNLRNGMVVDDMNKWISKEMKYKTALPDKSATKENMNILSLPDYEQKCLSKKKLKQKTAHLPSRSSLLVNNFSHLKHGSVPDNTLRKKTMGISSLMGSVVLYPPRPVNVTQKKAATVSIKQKEHATYYDDEGEEPDEMLSGLSVTLEETESMKGGNRSRHSFNPLPEIIYSPSYVTAHSSSPEKFQGMPCHILQLPLHPTAAFPYKENHLPLFYIPHVPLNLMNVATPSSLYANETTPLVLILIPGPMQGEPRMTHQSSLPSTTELTKSEKETTKSEAGVSVDSLLPSTIKSTEPKTETTRNIHSQTSHTTERLTKTTPTSKSTLKPGFVTNILGSTISLTLHNKTKLTACLPYLTSKGTHEAALEHSVPGTTLQISLSETSSAKIKLQSKPSTIHSKYSRNKSSTIKTTANPKKLTTVNINKISPIGDKCISHLATMGNNVYRSSKPPHSFTEIIYNRLEEDEDEELGSTLISIPLTTAKIMIEPKSHKRVKRTSALTTYYVKSPVKIMIMTDEGNDLSNAEGREIITDEENDLSNAEGRENLVNGSTEGEPLGKKLNNFRDLKKKRYFIYLEKDKPNVTISKSHHPLHMCSVDGVMDDFSSYALHEPSHFIQVIENYNCSKYIVVPGRIILTNEARPRMLRRSSYEVQELSHSSMSVNEADLQNIISTSQVTSADNQMFMFPGSSAVVSCQGSSRKMQPQDTPNMMYRWKREDGQEISGQHSWETAYGELCLNNVGAEDAGKYVCHSSSFNPNSEKEEEHSYTHHISVVLLPKYLHQVMVHYHAEPTCEDIDVDLLKLFLPEIIGEHLCGSRELCRVEVVQPYCYRGMRGEMYLSLTTVIRDAALYSMLPALNQTFCGMTCKGKADAKFVLLMNQNLAAFFKSPIHSRLSYRSANFTPVESSFSSRMVTGCRAGFHLEQGFCEPCPADWYSEEDSARCNKCGAGKYQPRPGSSMCLKCPHPFAAKKCLSLFHQQYAYIAIALVSLLIVKVLVLYLGMQFCKPFLLWYKKQRERKRVPDDESQSWERSRYTESRRSRRREERRARASRSQLYYYQPLPEEEGGCTCKRQRRRRSSKHKIPPKPPPPDFF